LFDAFLMAIHDDYGTCILRLAVITPNNDSYFRPKKGRTQAAASGQYRRLLAVKN
jgi:hypothetical protein